MVTLQSFRRCLHRKKRMEGCIQLELTTVPVLFEEKKKKLFVLRVSPLQTKMFVTFL
jgi:hypothetical protein